MRISDVKICYAMPIFPPHAEVYRVFCGSSGQTSLESNRSSAPRRVERAGETLYHFGTMRICDANACPDFPNTERRNHATHVHATHVHATGPTQRATPVWRRSHRNEIPQPTNERPSLRPAPLFAPQAIRRSYLYRPTEGMRISGAKIRCAMPIFPHTQTDISLQNNIRERQPSSPYDQMRLKTLSAVEKQYLISV